jgi:hypothetical protein
MSDGALFSTDMVPTESRHQGRLWVADLLDVATAGLLGWAALRALEQERTGGRVVVAVALAWVAVSAVGGVTGRTLWRELAGVRLVRKGRAPGLRLGLGRAFTAPLELLLTPVLLRRPLDAKLDVYGEAVPGARLKGVALQLPWLAVMAGAVWLLVTPTKAEMLKYLDKTLTGWHCCHGTREVTWECRTSLDRVVRNARGGDPDARAVVADCPVAAKRVGP